MANSKNSQHKSRIRQITGRLVLWFRWLVKPASSLPESLINQSGLLAWTLIMVIPLALIVLVAVIAMPSGPPQLTGYIIVTLSAVFIFIIAFILNRIGHYPLAAFLTILGAVTAPWGSVIVDPVILQGDLIPLNFVTVPVLLSSLLLPPLITALVAGVQMAALSYVRTLMPDTANINWVSFITFIIVIEAISILASFITQRDLKQIEHQKRLLREQSIRDYLTGLYNRRYLDETLEREVRRAERAKLPIGIIMLDIDHFKRLNDKFTHAAGDVVLQNIASLLKAKIRYADIVCRYGGEEFVVVMPEASLNATLRRAEALREEVRNLNLRYKNQNLGKITISLGVAVYPDHGSTGQEVMQSADSALYTAKLSGRDRVVVAS